MAQTEAPTKHRMTRRSNVNDYSQPGMYHITLRVAEGAGRPFGRVVGDASLPDGNDDAPHVELTAIGEMVKQELLNSIRTFYPMVEVQDHVVMPEHMHFILEVHGTLVSQRGVKAHLGQVIAGFKKGCNRRYWEITGQGKPAPTNASPTDGGTANGSPAEGPERGKPAPTGSPCPAVCPQGYKVPSRGSTGRQALFEEGYVDVMPLHSGQLAQQRAYIRNNPRSRLLRSTHRDVLQPQRGGIDTALSLKAMKGYLLRECAPRQVTPETLALVESRLLMTAGLITCDSYGNRRLLAHRLLPVVCHRRDAAFLPKQKAQCLKAAQEGLVLVSARIAKGEQEIMDAVMALGLPVVLVADNGMPAIYHPSTERMALCLADKLLIVTPWQYHYRNAEEGISVAWCKAMNCVVQALCRMKDDWWKV